MRISTCIVFCQCSANVISPEVSQRLRQSFKNLKVDVIELNDLCAYSVHEKNQLQAISHRYDHKIIVACYKRAVKNILQQAGVDFGSFDVLNFKELNPDEILEKLTNLFQLEKGEANYKSLKSELDVPAWFPVIDQSLCTLCGQCARFCLFGVYQFDKKSLLVKNPLSCKNLCPACGRTCPASAIMFPRLNENSTLAGAEPKNQEPALAQKKSLLSQLNERNRIRPSIIKQDFLQLANEERTKALEELKKENAKEE